MSFTLEVYSLAASVFIALIVPTSLSVAVDAGKAYAEIPLSETSTASSSNESSPPFEMTGDSYPLAVE